MVEPKRVLIICTYFAPDSAIAAKRLTVFAGLLAKLGNDVTVICSGRLINAPTNEYDHLTTPLRILNYRRCTLGDERVRETGESVGPKGRLSLLPKWLRAPAAALYTPYAVMKNHYVECRLIHKTIAQQLPDEQFDVVFSSFGDSPNLYGGLLASSRYQCPWILDLRDNVVRRAGNNIILKIAYSYMQSKYLPKANVITCVSSGLRDYLKNSGLKDVEVLYNGFIGEGETSDTDASISTASVSLNDSGVLRFCYTGQMYGNKRDLTPFFDTMQGLIEEGIVNPELIEFHYAGPHFDFFLNQMRGIDKLCRTVNHGLLPHDEASALQEASDVFLVATWNNKGDEGVLTGKLYEALQHRMPVLAVVNGNKPCSEIREIIELYSLGVCYEMADSYGTQEKLYSFLLKQYRAKTTKGSLDYRPDPRAFELFNYEAIVHRLNDMMDIVVFSKYNNGDMREHRV